MKTRNHLSHVGIAHEVNIISNGLIDIPMLQILSQDGVVHKEAVEPELDQETALKMYTTMQFTRVLDERMVAAQRQGRISFYLASTGEEGATVASAAALEPQDMIMSQYREQGSLAWIHHGTVYESDV